jgi:ribosomal protein S16
MRKLRRGVLIIKLQRKGLDKQPCYNIVVKRRKSNPKGSMARIGFIEAPKYPYQIVKIDFAALYYWIAQGAVMDPRVHSYLNISDEKPRHIKYRKYDT